LAFPGFGRLLTIPGVDVGTAAAVIAAVGDITRFPTTGQLVAYLGLDPKVRQSGSEPARYGHISKRGDPQARSMLVEAAWISIRLPGPLRAFGERVRARRGAQIAAVAVARKLVVLCWHLLTKDQDYAFARPSLTRQKTRRLELLAGAPSRRAARQPHQQPARSRARATSPGRARLSAPHRGLVHNGTEGWCGCDTGARISKALEGQSRAAGHKPLTPALRSRQSPAPPQIIPLPSTRRDPAANARPCAKTHPPARQKNQYRPYAL
jgi:hypothetical protein